MRRLCALALTAALGAALFVSEVVAAPTVIQWYDPVTNQNRTVTPTDPLPVTDTQRDRDFPLITQLFSGQVLDPGRTYAMTVAVPVQQYTRAAILLTWAIAAADTDSVRIAVRIYGTTSSTSGNYYSWTPGGQAVSDSCVGTGYVVTDSTAASPQRCLAPNIAFWVQKAPYMSTASPSMSYLAQNITNGTQGGTLTTGQLKLRKIPLSMVRFGSANGVTLNLVEASGAPAHFEYILVHVTNAGRQSLTNVEANLKLRVQ